jgi:hypothetical protein
MAPANVDASESRVDHPVAVWIDDGEGIVRGVADSVTAGGARVRLAAPPAFREGAGVALRICLAPGRPSVATTARVSWVRRTSGQAECGLEWTEVQGSLGEWLASRN